ncbi:NEK1 [Symbiodinium sp. KB8]|nr:NEK1 [Symbiodinium sp. KB8]
MGHSASADSAECAAPGATAPSPSSLLWVRILTGSKLQTPTSLNGDSILKVCRWLLGHPHTWRLYVTVSVGRGQGQTEIVHVPTHGDVNFNHAPIPFILEDIVTYDPGLGPRASSLASMSLASTLLDRRIPEMTIKVYRVRRICQDALVSVARLPISTTELAGTSREHTISLANGCGMITVRCSFNCSVNDLPNLQSVLAYPRRHSLAKFAQALAQLLQGEDGLEILQRAVPKALHLPTEKVTSTMQSFLVSLCNQVSMLSDDESDREVMQRFAPLSRSIQDFIAECTHNSANVAALTEEWLCGTFSLCAQKAGGQKLASMNNYMIKEFLKQGERYPGMDHLVPIDSRGDTVADWLNSPPMVRRDFVPREAVLGKGMFGTVWRAMDLRSRQWYAVKRSNTSRQPTIAREREVTNHVLMNPHPCIVQIFGNHYIETGSCFSSLVMEFCAGGDLQDKVNEAHTDHGYRLPDQAVTWLGQIFLGLEHLHMVLGTLQRDLKPRNVVFSDDGRAKLTDFGMGRIGLVSTGAFTLQNCPPGSPAYVAPEVVLQKPYDFKADIYSFGVVCWNVLTGGVRDSGGDWSAPCYAFSSQNFANLANNHRLLEKHVKHPSRYNVQSAPSEASDFVLLLTKLDPEQRPDHGKIRSVRFMSSLGLPAPDARRSQIDEWIRNRERAKDKT